MKVDKRWQEEVKKVNRGLFIEWDESLHRWRLKHKDDRNGLVRDVFLVETHDGEYKDLDMGTVRMLKDSVMWDLVGKFPDPREMFLHLERERKARKAHYELERMSYLRDFNREHRTEWRAALENARSGIFERPEVEEKKIIIT